jgi:nicotinamidase-related amidase
MGWGRYHPENRGIGERKAQAGEFALHPRWTHHFSQKGILMLMTRLRSTPALVTRPALCLWLLAALAVPRLLSGRPIELAVQQRSPRTGQTEISRMAIDPARTLVVVVDMWDKHWCKTYTERVANMVPRMNQTLSAARALGLQVVWAPSDVVGFYKDYPQRKAMVAIPAHAEPKTIAFDPPAEPDGKDCCECGPDRPCQNGAVWSRQQPGLEIGPDDLIADCNNARELFNLCVERNIDTLIYLGVASNMCVCHRDAGLFNAKRHGFRVLFVRDLVEAITANGLDPATRKVDWNFTPAKGTARTEHYLEQHLAGSLESRQLIERAGANRGTREGRPHLVFVVADDEYRTEETLPAFARKYLEKSYRCTFCLAAGNDPTNRNRIPGLEALADADLLVLSMRRRALPVPAMDRLERYIRSGKPLVALRVSVVPFQVEPAQRPAGHVIWRDFDQEVLGCHYRGYDAAARQTGTDVWVAPGAQDHAILAGLRGARFHSAMWIYHQSPLAATTTVLLKGRWSDNAAEEPVAWTNTYEGGRVFYTTLGHWEDFKIDAFNQLLVNAIKWAL